MTRPGPEALAYLDPQVGLATIDEEIQALAEMRARIGAALGEAAELILSRTGRVVVTGIGKSGHIGGKIAATLASTGTPAFFVHSTEALHGDSGMVGPQDTVILITNSGTTGEVVAFGYQLAERGIALIAMTGGKTSPIANLAAVVLDIGVDREADPLNLAPTSSTTLTLVAGDALAMMLSVARDFTATDFGLYHPGGALGKKTQASGKEL